MLTATELSEKFDVSIRTVYRDIRKLEDSGVPVITLEGKGYTIMDGYTVAPVQFTEKQANALITAHHLVKQTHDTSFIEDFEEALTKVKSVFRGNIQEKSEFLSRKIHVFEFKEGNVESHALSELQLAITHFNIVEINYQKPDDEEPMWRKVEPFAMYASNNKWILLAWCHLRQDNRAFRVDRIKDFKVLSEKFEDRKFDFPTYFMSSPYNPHN